MWRDLPLSYIVEKKKQKDGLEWIFGNCTIVNNAYLYY